MDQSPPDMQPEDAFTPAGSPPPPSDNAAPAPDQTPQPEDGGPKGPEPTRYGDWERKGIAVDF